MTNQQMGRLAFRHEGDWWVAYYAMTDTMDRAIELGRIRMVLVSDPKQQARKEGFMRLMKRCVSDMIETTLGRRPTWPLPPQAAPESERSGHG